MTNLAKKVEGNDGANGDESLLRYSGVMSASRMRCVCICAADKCKWQKVNVGERECM